jgi:hypothetical protein
MVHVLYIGIFIRTFKEQEDGEHWIVWKQVVMAWIIEFVEVSKDLVDTEFFSGNLTSQSQIIKGGMECPEYLNNFQV